MQQQPQPQQQQQQQQYAWQQQEYCFHQPQFDEEKFHDDAYDTFFKKTNNYCETNDENAENDQQTNDEIDQQSVPNTADFFEEEDMRMSRIIVSDDDDNNNNTKGRERRLKKGIYIDDVVNLHDVIKTGNHEEFEEHLDEEGNVGVLIVPGEEYCPQILSRSKLWDIRSIPCKKWKNKIIGITGKGGIIHGQGRIRKSIKMAKEEILNNVSKHQITKREDVKKYILDRENCYVWFFELATHFCTPLSYDPKPGQGQGAWANVKLKDIYL